MSSKGLQNDLEIEHKELEFPFVAVNEYLVALVTASGVASVAGGGGAGPPFGPGVFRAFQGPQFFS